MKAIGRRSGADADIARIGVINIGAACRPLAMGAEAEEKGQKTPG